MLFRSIYYAIRGRYHYLFRDEFGPLPRMLHFLDQRCLAAFLHEMTRHRDASLQARQHAQPTQQDTQQPITDFFQSQDTSGLADDADVSESQSHDSCASGQTPTSESTTSRLCSQPALPGSTSLSFFTIGPPDDQARLGRVTSKANHLLQGFFRPPI